MRKCKGYRIKRTTFGIGPRLYKMLCTNYFFFSVNVYNFCTVAEINSRKLILPTPKYYVLEKVIVLFLFDIKMRGLH